MEGILKAVLLLLTNTASCCLSSRNDFFCIWRVDVAMEAKSWYLPDELWCIVFSSLSVPDLLNVSLVPIS